jgi:hypothetical protein
MNGLLVSTGFAAAAGAAAIAAYVGLVTGRLTIDLGIGRRTRLLAPSTSTSPHPARLSSPPLPRRTPTDCLGPAGEVEILERAGQMVLAVHRTAVGSGLTAVTVETFPRPAEPDGLPAPARPGAPSTIPPTGPGSPTPASSAPTFGGSARPGVTCSPAAGCTRSATLWPRSRPKANAAHSDGHRHCHLPLVVTHRAMRWQICHGSPARNLQTAATSPLSGPSVVAFCTPTVFNGGVN